jgi:hypothetical protein
MALCSWNDYTRRVKVRWTQARADHIATRSQRYPGATDIAVTSVAEAVADSRAMVSEPDPRSKTGAERRNYQEAADE